jgi:hypothetical protein
LQLECAHKIEKLESVILTDPFAFEKSHKANLKEIESIDLYTNVYPDSLTVPLQLHMQDTDVISYPGCIFIPDEKIMRIILKGVAVLGKTETDSNVLLRFGLIENIDILL